MTNSHNTRRPPNRDLNDRVAAEFRAEMARQQRRVSDLADALGVHTSQMTKRLHGRVALTLHDVVEISRWLGIDPGHLISSLTREEQAA